MPPASPTVCVIIAARNAAATIQRAIRSALRENQVAEVMVVDDGSSDDTATVSMQADDRSGRLKLLKLDENRGPAFARNYAITHSSAPLLAVLDADDFFLNRRFDGLLGGDDWDFVADNIVFIDSRSAEISEPAVPSFDAAPRFLDLAGFIEGNISRRGASRGEIGFLKPVMRRSFLDRHNLRYDDGLRLGEDYDLYARALVKGARYKIVHSCGYGAVVRPDSLSGQHKTADLKRLYEADRAILESSQMPAAAEAAMRRHERHVRGRYELRHFLDLKARHGLTGAALHTVKHPAALPAIAGGIAADKFHAFKGRKKAGNDTIAQPRYLLQAQVAASQK